MSNGILSYFGVPQPDDPTPGGAPPQSPPTAPPAAAPSAQSSAPPDMPLVGPNGQPATPPAAPPPQESAPMPQGMRPIEQTQAALDPTAPKQAAPAPPKAPALTAQQQAGVNAVGAKAADMLANGRIDQSVIANDLAQEGLDAAQHKNAMDQLKALDDYHAQVMDLGRQQAIDQSGSKYWKDASVGEKIGRVLLGVVTLGGSEHYIGSAIKNQVAQDQKNIDTAGNVYQLMLKRGETVDKAAAIDATAQAHHYATALDTIAAKYASPLIQQRVAALKMGMQKDVSTAIIGSYKDQQQRKIEQQNANTSAMNAKTERMVALDNMGKPKPGQIEQAKYDAETTYRTLDGSLGQARTPDEAKKINNNTLAFKTVTNAITRIKGALTLGHSWAGQDHNTVENEAKAINAAVASMEDGGIKISNRNAELVQRFSDLNAHTGFDATRARELDELQAGLRQDLVNSYAQAQR